MVRPNVVIAPNVGDDRPAGATVAPSFGTRLGLIGVRHDDTLNVRDAPNGTIIGQLKFVPTSTSDYELFVYPPGDPSKLGSGPPTTGPPLSQRRTYVVQPGDTLPKIARGFDVTVQALMVVNGKEDGWLRIGEQLVIPSTNPNAPWFETTRDGVIALAHSRRPISTVWHKVNIGGIEGWVSDHYVGQIGAAPDRFGDRLEAAVAALGTTSSVADLTERVTVMVSQIDPELRVTMVGAEGTAEGQRTVEFDVVAWVAAIDDDPADYRRPVRGHRVGVSLRAHGDWTRSTEPRVVPYTIQWVGVYPICAATAKIAANGSCST